MPTVGIEPNSQVILTWFQQYAMSGYELSEPSRVVAGKLGLGTSYVLAVDK